MGHVIWVFKNASNNTQTIWKPQEVFCKARCEWNRFWRYLEKGEDPPVNWMGVLLPDYEKTTSIMKHAYRMFEKNHEEEHQHKIQQYIFCYVCLVKKIIITSSSLTTRRKRK